MRQTQYHIIKNIIMALFIMMFFVACKKEKSSGLLEYNGRFPDESAENITLTLSEAGRTSFVIYTPLMNSYREDTMYVDYPKGIKVVSYNNDGRKQAVLTAKYASVVNNSTYKASKDVVIIDLIKGDTLTTQELIWDQNRHIIYSVKLVKQAKADGSVNWGDGFEADEHFTKYTIKHPRGEMAVDF